MWEMFSVLPEQWQFFCKQQFSVHCVTCPSCSGSTMIRARSGGEGQGTWPALPCVPGPCHTPVSWKGFPCVLMVRECPGDRHRIETMDCLAPFLLGFVRLGLGSGQADNIWEDTCKGPLCQDRFTVAQKGPCGTERSLAHTSRFP